MSLSGSLCLQDDSQMHRQVFSLANQIKSFIVTFAKNSWCLSAQSKLTVLLRSRGTRERILIWFRRLRRCEKLRIFVDCKLAGPLGFCMGCGPRFRVPLSRHACSLLWLLSLFSTFWGFL